MLLRERPSQVISENDYAFNIFNCVLDEVKNLASTSDIMVKQWKQRGVGQLYLSLSMNIVTWNVWGMNKVYRHQEFKKFCHNNHVALITVIKNRVSKNSAPRLITKLVGNWLCSANY